MKRAIVSIFVGLCWIATANAESALLDLSKPMAGKSRYVVGANGTPLELGASAETDPSPEAQSGSSSSSLTPSLSLSYACRNGGCSASGSPATPRTVYVSGYMRRNGTYVAPYVRAAPRGRR